MTSLGQCILNVIKTRERCVHVHYRLLVNRENSKALHLRMNPISILKPVNPVSNVLRRCAGLPQTLRSM